MANNLTVQEVEKEMQLVQAELARETKKFAAVLPKHIPVERFQRVIVTALMNNTDLLLVPPEMFLRECIKAAQDGLLPDGKLGALVPRGNARKGNITVTWQPMIAGIRQKARNSGQISVWDAHCVYANDPFKVRLGADPNIEHEIDFTKDDRGEMIAAYSIAIMKDGTKSFEIMTKKQVEQIRDRSDAYKAFKAGYIKSTPWESDFEEMARKTVAKRHSKQLPMSSDLDDLMRRDDDLYAFGDGQDVGDVTAAASGKPKNLSLSSRLDAIAGDDEGESQDETVTEDGEIIDREQSDPADGGASDTGNEASSDQDDDVEQARKAGMADKKAGKAKRQMPAKYRNDDRLAEAYMEGHDAAAKE